MPQVFKIGSYWVYFWSSEGEPLEPVHVHVSEGLPRADSTKLWITKSGGCIVGANRSKIPERVLRNIARIVEARSDEIVSLWIKHFGRAEFYC